MGTRADFYVGVGSEAEWLGSLGFSGSPRLLLQHSELTPKMTESDFVKKVADLLALRADATTPEMGWPWPWLDSSLTDFSYTVMGGKLHCSYYGRRWLPIAACLNYEEDNQYIENFFKDMLEEDEVIWPSMKDRQNISLGIRSGQLHKHKLTGEITNVQLPSRYDVRTDEDVTNLVRQWEMNGVWKTDLEET